MASRVRVRGGVAVGRLIAAPDVPALEADPQVKPLLARGQAVLAAIDPLGKLGDLDVVAVFAEDHASKGSSHRRARS